MCQVEHLGKERTRDRLTACWRCCKPLCTHHGHLGLKLNFQSLQSTFQFCYLILGGTGCPGICRNLCLQRRTLEKKADAVRAGWRTGRREVACMWPRARASSRDDLPVCWTAPRPRGGFAQPAPHTAPACHSVTWSGQSLGQRSFPRSRPLRSFLACSSFPSVKRNTKVIKRGKQRLLKTCIANQKTETKTLQATPASH